MAIQVKVLVVDDEEIVLKSTRRILKRDEEHEFLVDTALSAAEGLALISDKKYDIIITDLMMPKMDGLEFIDKIRQSDQDIVIIMITGYATIQTALKALRKGAFDYIAKPYTIEELRSVVKSAARTVLASGNEASKECADREGENAEKYRGFFNQTYASRQPDGTLIFGVEAAFITLIGKPISMELSKIGENVSQGFQFGSITNSQMKVFILRAPFGGVVLEVNDEAVENMNLIAEDPCGKGWLLRVNPGDFEGESKNLGV